MRMRKERRKNRKIERDERGYKRAGGEAKIPAFRRRSMRFDGLRFWRVLWTEFSSRVTQGARVVLESSESCWRAPVRSILQF